MHWTELTPEQAAGLDRAALAEITMPLNELGEPCPWPWEPQQLIGVPLGQYHCPYCGGMVVAGVPHVDYRDLPDDLAR